MDVSAYLAEAAALRLATLIRRRAVRYDERDDIGIACVALRIDPTQEDVDHPVADLYRALVLLADSNKNPMLYLSFLHCEWLKQAIQRLDNHWQRQLGSDADNNSNSVR